MVFTNYFIARPSVSSGLQPRWAAAVLKTGILKRFQYIPQFYSIDMTSESETISLEKDEQQDQQDNTVVGYIVGYLRFAAILFIAGYLIYVALTPPPTKPLNVPKVEGEDDEVDDSAKPFEISALSGTTMGSIHYSVKGETDTDLKGTVQQVLDRVDASMSTYREDSDVSKFNVSDSTDWFSVSKDTAKVVQIALDISTLTDGAFDITVGPLVDRWGFGPEEVKSPPTQEEIDEILNTVGYKHIEVRLDPPALKKDAAAVQIDLSAIAKGFAVDTLADELEKRGAVNYVIEVGGETRTKGEKATKKPWTVGIEIPMPGWLGEPKIQRLAHLGSQSLATSGDYHNFIEAKGIRYSHIIDPKTGWPTERPDVASPDSSVRLGSVSVVAANCATADALATGLYVLGPEKGLKLANSNNLAVLFMLREDKLEKKGPGPRFTVREVMSDSFKKLDTWLPEE